MKYIKPRRIQQVEVAFKPKKMQEKIIKLMNKPSTRMMFVCMSRQYGKSMLARYFMLQWTAKASQTVAYVTPTFRLAKEVYKKMVTILPKEMILTANSQDLVIELMNLSRIIFFSAENIDTVRGFTLTHLICDETAFYKDYTPQGNHWYWNILSPMLDVEGRKQLFISTPNGQQGFFYEFFQKGIRDMNRIVSVHASIYTDETKDKEWIEEKKKMYPTLRWKQEYECEFLEGAASYFSNYGELFTEKEYKFNEPQWVGVDWSSVGSDETIVTFMNESNQTIQYKIEGSLDEKYAKIAGLLNEHSTKIKWIVLEKNSIGAVMSNEVLKLLDNRLKRLVEIFNTTNSSKSEIVELLSLSIEKKEIHFIKGDDELLDQFENFSYEILPSGKVRYEAMNGHKDDRILSLSFANYARHKKAKVDREYMAVFKR